MHALHGFPFAFKPAGRFSTIAAINLSAFLKIVIAVLQGTYRNLDKSAEMC